MKKDNIEPEPNDNFLINNGGPPHREHNECNSPDEDLKGNINNGPIEFQQIPLFRSHEFGDCNDSFLIDNDCNITWRHFNNNKSVLFGISQKGGDNNNPPELFYTGWFESVSLDDLSNDKNQIISSSSVPPPVQIEIRDEPYPTHPPVQIEIRDEPYPTHPHVQIEIRDEPYPTHPQIRAYKNKNGRTFPCDQIKEMYCSLFRSPINTTPYYKGPDNCYFGWQNGPSRRIMKLKDSLGKWPDINIDALQELLLLKEKYTAGTSNNMVKKRKADSTIVGKRIKQTKIVLREQSPVIEEISEKEPLVIDEPLAVEGTKGKEPLVIAGRLVVEGQRNVHPIQIFELSEEQPKKKITIKSVPIKAVGINLGDKDLISFLSCGRETRNVQVTKGDKLFDGIIDIKMYSGQGQKMYSKDTPFIYLDTFKYYLSKSTEKPDPFNLLMEYAYGNEERFNVMFYTYNCLPSLSLIKDVNRLIEEGKSPCYHPKRSENSAIRLYYKVITKYDPITSECSFKVQYSDTKLLQRIVLVHGILKRGLLDDIFQDIVDLATEGGKSKQKKRSLVSFSSGFKITGKSYLWVCTRICGDNECSNPIHLSINKVKLPKTNRGKELSISSYKRKKCTNRITGYCAHDPACILEKDRILVEGVTIDSDSEDDKPEYDYIREKEDKSEEPDD